MWTKRKEENSSGKNNTVTIWQITCLKILRFNSKNKISVVFSFQSKKTTINSRVNYENEASKIVLNIQNSHNCNMPILTTECPWTAHHLYAPTDNSRTQTDIKYLIEISVESWQRTTNGVPLSKMSSRERPHICKPITNIISRDAIGGRGGGGKWTLRKVGINKGRQHGFVRDEGMGTTTTTTPPD